MWQFMEQGANYTEDDCRESDHLNQRQTWWLLPSGRLVESTATDCERRQNSGKIDDMKKLMGKRGSRWKACYFPERRNLDKRWKGFKTAAAGKLWRCGKSVRTQNRARSDGKITTEDLRKWQTLMGKTVRRCPKSLAADGKKNQLESPKWLSLNKKPTTLPSSSGWWMESNK